MKPDLRLLAGWLLGAAAVAVGYLQWGWRGVVLALTLVVFWLLLQFSRALRSLRAAAGAPVGSVGSAVMLHARLRVGMTLPQILPLTGSLGRRVDTVAPQSGEAYVWADASGDAVQVQLQSGRVARWHLSRAGGGHAPDAAPAEPG